MKTTFNSVTIDLHETMGPQINNKTRLNKYNYIKFGKTR